MEMLAAAVNWCYTVLTWAIMLRVLMSWVRPPTYNQFYREFEHFLYRLTEPLLALVRRYLPPTGGIDLSPIVVMLLLGVIRRLLLQMVW